MLYTSKKIENLIFYTTYVYNGEDFHCWLCQNLKKCFMGFVTMV